MAYEEPALALALMDLHLLEDFVLWEAEGEKCFPGKKLLTGALFFPKLTTLRPTAYTSLLKPAKRSLFTFSKN
jgi:hypothetical protein